MKNLEDYFQKAKDQEPVMSIGQVENLLSKPRATSVYKPEGFFDRFRNQTNLYQTLIASTMLAMFIISLFLFRGTYQPEPELDVFIPESQERITRLVRSLSENSTLSSVRLIPIGSYRTEANKHIPAHLSSTFKLSEKQLNLLGITITDDKIVYEGNAKGLGYINFEIVPNTRNQHENAPSVLVEVKQRSGVKEYDFYPWYLTDENGHKSVQYSFDKEPAMKMTNAFFYSVMDELIPVQVQLPGRKKMIFWFSSTPELLSLLESAADIDTLREKAPVPNTKGPDQKNTTINIELYPTVTTGHVEVKTVVSQTQDLEISVLNTSGDVVLVPVANQSLNEGDHNFSMDLSGFTDGLYFVRIKSDPGLLTIHRLFKE